VRIDKADGEYKYYNDPNNRRIIYISFGIIALALVSGKMVEKIIDNFVFTDDRSFEQTGKNL
jgi:hypothetical protein